MSLKKVAIIGAGRSGLVSAKYALENGLKPVVFEKSSDIGGLWSGKNPTIWNGLFTNISIYTMMFSDHPWPKNSPIFQSSNGIKNYLSSYAKRFNLEPHINLNTKVEQVKKLDNNKWKVNFLDFKSFEKKTEIFDCLILASGLHSKPRIPFIENSENFSGTHIHSSDFKLNDPNLKSKNIIVLGCSLSGTEISANLVNHAKKVINIFPRPYLVIPRIVAFKLDSKNYSIQPVDLFLNRRFMYDSSLSKDRIRRERINLFSKLFPYQTNKNLSHPSLYVDLESTSQEILFSISDYYIKLVQEKKITPICSKIKKFLSSNQVLLEDGSIHQVDSIIYCTGYDLDLSYLDKPILEAIKYSNLDYKFSLILYKCTFHPDLENFAMVGQVDGNFYTGDELQAKWANMVFSGKFKLPDKNVMNEEIKSEEERRKKNRRSQYPYGNHVQMIDRLGKEMNLLPDFANLKSQDPSLYDLFWYTSAVSSNFLYKQNQDLAIEVMNRVSEMNKRTYEFEQEPTYEEVVKIFSKFYQLPNGMFKFLNN